MERFENKEVKVYSKENCVQCDATIRKLGQLGIQYEVIMLEENPEILEQLKEEGYMQAPVVDTGEEKWSGYKPDKLKGLSNGSI